MAGPPDSPKQSFIAFVRTRSIYGRERLDPESVDHLRDIAKVWSDGGCHFYSGHVLCQAIDCAWGDLDLMTSCAQAAFQEFEIAVKDSSVTDLERIASLWMWNVEMGAHRWLFEPTKLLALHRILESELIQSLVRLAEATSDQATREGYLIRGFHLVTDFEGRWMEEFPRFEIHGTGMSGSGSGSLLLAVQSAFQRSINIGDYVAAQSFAAQCPGAFTTHGLLGWRAAVKGLLNSSEAAERFSEAAREFSQDVPDDARQAAGMSWSGINHDLWSKYFSARSMVAEIVRTPAMAAELVLQAKEELEGIESGFASPQVACFRIVLSTLDRILSGDADIAVSGAKVAFFQRIRLEGWDENEELVGEFLDQAEKAFSELRREPAMALLSTGVRDTLDALGRIPLVGVEVASAIGPAVAQRTFANLLSQNHSWIYNTIESINDESVLQQLILRIMQGRLPLYAQIRQGPIEYGKDIVVLVEENNEFILQMYQVKVGDISTSAWRIARAELEEMFLVDVPPVQLPAKPTRREGILIFNGHLNVYVEPVVDKWLAEQERAYGRSFLIMHLDLIVDWIMRKGLLAELRRALEELGVSIVSPELPPPT